MTLYRIVHAASGESVAQALDDGERVGWNHQCVKNDAYPWGMVGSDWTGAMIASKPYLFQTYFWGGIVGWTSEISPILTSLYHAWIILLRRSVNSTNSATDFVREREKRSWKSLSP